MVSTVISDTKVIIFTKYYELISKENNSTINNERIIILIDIISLKECEDNVVKYSLDKYSAFSSKSCLFRTYTNAGSFSYYSKKTTDEGVRVLDAYNTDSFVSIRNKYYESDLKIAKMN